MLLIAFLIVGPKDLPRVARWLGRMVGKLRRAIREIKKETGWDDLERELNDTRDTLKDLKKDLDVTPELKDAAAELNRSVNGVKEELQRTGQELREDTHETGKETVKN